MNEVIQYFVIPIGIAMLTVAMPLLLNIVNKIDEKHSSSHLAEEYRKETGYFCFYCFLITLYALGIPALLLHLYGCQCSLALVETLMLFFTFLLIGTFIYLIWLTIEYYSLDKIIERLCQKDDTYFSLYEIYKHCLKKDDKYNCLLILGKLKAKYDRLQDDAVLSQISTCMAETILCEKDAVLKEYFNNDEKEVSEKERDFYIAFGGFLVSQKKYELIYLLLKTTSYLIKYDCLNEICKKYLEIQSSFFNPYYFDGTDSITTNDVRKFLYCLILIRCSTLKLQDFDKSYNSILDDIEHQMPELLDKMNIAADAEKIKEYFLKIKT